MKTDASAVPLRTSILSVGENKGTPRIWIEGKFLQMAGVGAASPSSTWKPWRRDRWIAF